MATGTSVITKMHLSHVLQSPSTPLVGLVSPKSEISVSNARCTSHKLNLSVIMVAQMLRMVIGEDGTGNDYSHERVAWSMNSVLETHRRNIWGEALGKVYYLLTSPLGRNSDKLQSAKSPSGNGRRTLKEQSQPPSQEWFMSQRPIESTPLI